MLSEQVRQSAQAIDLALNEVAAAVAAPDAASVRYAAGTPAVLQTLAAIADRRSAIDLLSVEDADGVTLATSRGAPTGPVGPIYPAFDYLKHNRTLDTQVGVLRVSEATGALVVDFMRRIETADGRFLGVARASVAPRGLVSTYSPLSALPGRSYALFTRDGSIIARYPAAFGGIGQKMPKTSPWYEVVARGGGTFETKSSFDNEERIVAARTLPFSHLVVTVTILRSVALAHWREQALAIALCACLALAIAAFLGKALLVQFAKLGEKEGALRLQSQALALSNERFATALENMSQGLVVFDRSGHVVISNARYASIYGIEPGLIRPGVEARSILRLRAAKGLFAGQAPDAYVQDAMSRRFTDRRVDRLSDGRAILINHAACPDGGMVVTHEDVTEREEANARIAHMALHDELTQLANRTLFLSSLESLRDGMDAGCSVALMLCDLDDFKTVNDRSGHAAGDAVLRECARRMIEAIPHARVVARLGGDEFALAFPVEAGVDPLRVADRLIEAIGRPYLFQDQSLTIGACIGVVVFVDRDISIDAMIRRADLALYAAKSEGANRSRLFEPAMEQEATTRRELAADLAEAIAANRLHLVYQPVVNAETLRIEQMEALLRWRHPRRGLVPPQEFVRLAEETRQIEQLGLWVLRRACADAACWPVEVGVAVNVSPLQLSAADFVGSVMTAVADAGLSPRRLELEITESALLQDKGDAMATLHRLRDHDVSIALDDFGTGFASLSTLKTFPFDRLKIDRSFVADVTRDAGSAAIIASAVQLARAFDIEVTAEGVETREQMAALRAAGAKTMQGYLFGWPDVVDRGLPVIVLDRVDGDASRVA
jgi:diguanylate cyclase (GGDEF)-like protein